MGSELFLLVFAILLLMTPAAMIGRKKDESADEAIIRFMMQTSLPRLFLLRAMMLSGLLFLLTAIILLIT